MSDRYAKLDWGLVKHVEHHENELRLARKKLSDAILELSPFSKGDVVRDKDTGARYRVEGGSGGVHRGRLYLDLQLTRVYKSGRRDASSTTYRSDWNLEKVTD